MNYWDGIGKKISKKIRIQRIRNKEDNMPLGGNFCMFFNKWICKVEIIFCEQKNPSEKKVGYESINSYFSWNHRGKVIILEKVSYFVFIVPYTFYFYKKNPTHSWKNAWDLKNLNYYARAFLLMSRYTWRMIAFSRIFREERARVA